MSAILQLIRLHRNRVRTKLQYCVPQNSFIGKTVIGCCFSGI